MSLVAIKPLTRYEREMESLAQERRQFIDRNVKVMMNDPDRLAELMVDLFDDRDTAKIAATHLAGTLINDKPSVIAFIGMARTLATERAEQAWQRHLDAEAPECSECNYAKAMRDPYGTGDSPTQYECCVNQCPWGK